LEVDCYELDSLNWLLKTVRPLSTVTPFSKK